MEQRGKPVGLFDNVAYEAAAVALGPGDKLVMFSDGVLDALNEADLAQKEARLLRAAQEVNMDAIWQSLGIAAEEPAPDDMTCLVVGRGS